MCSVKKGRLQVCPDAALWALGKLEAGQTGSGASNVIGPGCVFGLLGLIFIQKQGREIGKLSVMNQVLAIWGRWLQKFLLAFWIVTSDSNQVSSKSDLQQAAFLGCLL